MCKKIELDTFMKSTKIIYIRVNFCCLILYILSGCSSSSKFIPPQPIPDDTQYIQKPVRNKINYMQDGFNKIVVLQLKQSFNLARQLRHLFGKPKQAMNINAFDEVENSTWFTNRNTYNPLSIDEIAKGPDRGTGPDINDHWTITRAKSEGVTPGFNIIDSQGDKYVIKFDPIGYSELATAAEVISTKIFYAAGYNVPENYICFFEPQLLKVGDDVTFVDEKGRERSMTKADIEVMLKKVEQLPDGRIRALASKYVEGDVLGGFHYESTRRDDPNDFIPHQHRRELRGLDVMCTWLKHFDTKAGNNMDVYVNTENGGYVKHYLIDFGSTLGSAALGPQQDHKGHENDFDPNIMFQNTFTLGLNVHPWEKLEPFKYSSIGRFDSFDLNPGKTKPNYPNPAFENRTNRDGYWGAKLVMSFTDEQLEAIVKQGQYSNPKAEGYLLRILKERRDKIGRYWYNKISPLDKFQIRKHLGVLTLEFADLGIEGKLWTSEQTSYQYALSIGGKKILTSTEINNQTSINLSELNKKIVNEFTDIMSSLSHLQWEIMLKLKRNSKDKWSKWVKVYLEPDPVENSFNLVGIKRKN